MIGAVVVALGAVSIAVGLWSLWRSFAAWRAARRALLARIWRR